MRLDERGDGREQIDGGRDAARESLRRDVHSSALEPGGLWLEGLLLKVLVAEGFDEKRIAELAAIGDVPSRGRRRHRVIVGAGDRLVQALGDAE